MIIVIIIIVITKCHLSQYLVVVPSDNDNFEDEKVVNKSKKIIWCKIVVILIIRCNEVIVMYTCESHFMLYCIVRTTTFFPKSVPVLGSCYGDRLSSLHVFWLPPLKRDPHGEATVGISPEIPSGPTMIMTMRNHYSVSGRLMSMKLMRLRSCSGLLRSRSKVRFNVANEINRRRKDKSAVQPHPMRYKKDRKINFGDRSSVPRDACWFALVRSTKWILLNT